MTKPRLTICTGTRHRPESLRRFVNSACAAATVPTDILIADASDVLPDDHPWHDVATYNTVQNVSRYHESPRLNPNFGYDQLCRKADTEYVAFFNDDCELIPGWDSIALDHMDKFTQIGIGCIYWRDPGGRFYLQSYRGIVYANFGIVRKSAADISGWFETREAFVPETGKMEKLSFYGNDCGIAFKMVDAGYAVAGIPGCKVEHHREQDAERAENYRKYVNGPHGNIAGQILFELWGGLQGFNQLRAKYNRFSYLHQPVMCE